MRIIVMHILLPLVIKPKLKVLVEPTQISRADNLFLKFPFETTLCEHPTNHLALKYSGESLVARAILARPAAQQIDELSSARNGPSAQPLGHLLRCEAGEV